MLKRGVSGKREIDENGEFGESDDLTKFRRKYLNLRQRANEGVPRKLRI